MIKANGIEINVNETHKDGSAEQTKKLKFEDFKMLSRKRDQVDSHVKGKISTPNQSQIKEVISHKNSVLLSNSGIKTCLSYLDKLDDVAILTNIQEKQIKAQPISRLSLKSRSKFSSNRPIMTIKKLGPEFCKEHFKINSIIKLGFGCIAAYSLFYNLNLNDSFKINSNHFISDEMLCIFGALVLCAAAIKYNQHLTNYHKKCSDLALQISNEVIQDLKQQIAESGQIYTNEETIIEKFAEKYNFTLIDFKSEIYNYLHDHMIENYQLNKVQLEQDETTKTYWVYKPEYTKI